MVQNKSHMISNGFTILYYRVWPKMLGSMVRLLWPCGSTETGAPQALACENHGTLQDERLLHGASVVKLIDMAPGLHDV